MCLQHRIPIIISTVFANIIRILIIICARKIINHNLCGGLKGRTVSIYWVNPNSIIYIYIPESAQRKPEYFCLFCAAYARFGEMRSSQVAF